MKRGGSLNLGNKHMNCTSTHWINALDLPEKDQKLGLLLRLAPLPLGYVHVLGIRNAVELMKAELERSYRPSAQDMRAIREIVDIARGYACLAYGSDAQFVAGAMGRLPARPSNPAVMLTGYSGYGKSRLLQAVSRLFETERFVQPSPSLPSFPIRSIACVAFERDVTPVGMMNQISNAIGGDADYKAKTQGDLRHARLRTYQVGCCCLLLDETQYISRGADSSALPAKLLGQATGLGPPVIYAANFTLGHRLKKRPPEDQRRLLSAPIVMVPDEASDPAFIGFIEDIILVMAGVLRINAKIDADEIHALSFGLRGPVMDLVLTAYKVARTAQTSGEMLEVTMDHVRAANQHVYYQHHRESVKTYQNDALGFDKIPLAYKCPFTLPASTAAKIRTHANRIRQRQVEDRIHEETRTLSEREAEKLALKARQNVGLKSSVSGVASLPLAPRVARRITADDLRANL